MARRAGMCFSLYGRKTPGTHAVGHFPLGSISNAEIRERPSSDTQIPVKRAFHAINSLALSICEEDYLRTNAKRQFRKPNQNNFAQMGNSLF